MSYPVPQQPVAAPPPPATTGRPAVVAAPAVRLGVMATTGLIYAITTLAIVPGTVRRFQVVFPGHRPDDLGRTAGGRRLAQDEPGARLSSARLRR